MCRIAVADGTHMSVALAHQNEHWKGVTPERIREAAGQLAQSLHRLGVGLVVFPSAEVMVRPDLVSAWKVGDLVSVADHRQFMLIEMPDGIFVEVGTIVQGLRDAGIRPILAHPERHPEFLHDPGRIEELIHLGCLVQVSSGSVTRPANRNDERALRDWFQRGIVHVLGSDGHSRKRRPPKMGDAYRQIIRWAGSAVADRVCSTNGMAILQGLPMRIPDPTPRKKGWFLNLWSRVTASP
jgi:protein-tyrosine phosphatase